LNRGRGAHFFNQSLRSWKKVAGFTLVELLIVIGITAALSVVGVGFYVNQQKAKILENTAQEIANYLHYVQQKSVSQEQGLQWGVHFENPTSGSDFYALYTGTTYSSPIETKYLPAGIEFQTPSSGNSVNTSFSKLTGLNYSEAEQEIIIRLISNQIARVIRTTANGLITSGEGEKGYWKFDEGSGTTAYDSTIYHNNGTLYNSPTWQSSSNCVSGSCLSFNGSTNYVEIQHNSSLMPSSITVEGWIKFNSTETGSWMMVNKATGGTSGSYYIYGNNLSSCLWSIFGPTGTRYNAGFSTTFVPDNWYYLVGTFDATTGIMKSYVNGQLKNTTINATFGSNSANVLLGRYTSGYYLDGLIDEVRIYNRALSPVEILQHYNSRS